MREFFKYMFASMLGSLLALIAGIFLFFMILVGMVASLAKSGDEGQVTAMKPNSIVVLDLNYDITERTKKDFFANFDFLSMEAEKQLGLNDVLANIAKAKADDNVKGIFMNVSMMPSGLATTEAIRNQLIDFKTSGKFVYAYGEVISQKGYYLASVADKVYLNPVGIMEFKGFSSQLVFFKNMLDRLQIEPQIFYAGKYKSATEPFRYTEMSEPNKEQVLSYMNDFYGRFISDIATSRKMDATLLDSLADNLIVRTPSDAAKEKLVDGLKYYDEVMDEIKAKVGAKEDKDLNLVGLNKYDKAKGKDKKDGSDKIAVIYAEGNIVDGEGEEDNIGSERFAETIRKIRQDKNVKAIVLRVNSGGGSALASDIILRELQLAHKTMPVIVSMGDVAASGGYYIACAADTIVAQPNTITGSIGVFGILPNLQGFFNDKLGVTFDGVKTGKFSDMGNVGRPLTPEEKMIIQAGVDTIYLNFKSRVADGRGMSLEYVDSIAQGRVWTGVQAKSLGLVDVLGSLDDAIAIAANKAGLKDYGTVDYPKEKDALAKLFGNMDEEVEAYFVKKQMGEFYPLWTKMQEVKEMKGIMTKMPYEVEIY